MMSTEKMRHDFEQFIIRRDGSIWVTVMGDQRSYNEPIERDFYVWRESRAAIEVDLPAPAVQGGNCIRDHAIRDTLESLGLKVKP